MKRFTLAMTVGLLFINMAHADSGAWIASWVDLFWDNDANWSGASFPNGAGEVAAFIGEHPGTYSIDSAQDITLGALHFDSPGHSLSLAFASHDLVFESSGGQSQANIFVGKDQSHSLDTPITLLTNVAISAGSNASLNLNDTISGDYSLSIFADPNGHINSNVGHSYSGSTVLHSGWLHLNGPASATNIPGDITVLGGAYLTHDQNVSNNYAAGSNLHLDGGNLDVNGTTQTLHSLQMDKRAVVYGAPGSTLALSSDTVALRMREDSLITIDTIVIENGGAITNDQTSLGNGYLFGMVAPQGHMNVDLNDTTVTINSSTGIYPQNKDLLLDFVNVHFGNGALLKTGEGLVIFEGNDASIPNLSVLDGRVQIGRPDSPAAIDSVETVSIFAGTALNGYGTLGIDGALLVANAGFIIPGDYALEGSLTISGDFAQELGGSLLIQGRSKTNVNTLVVKHGDVSLSGFLYFSALPQASYSPGDEVVLVDNPGGTITGNFIQFQANLPQGLSASLSYTSDQVIMNIAAARL